MKKLILLIFNIRYGSIWNSTRSVQSDKSQQSENRFQMCEESTGTWKVLEILRGHCFTENARPTGRSVL